MKSICKVSLDYNIIHNIKVTIEETFKGVRNSKLSFSIRLVIEVAVHSNKRSSAIESELGIAVSLNMLVSMLVRLANIIISSEKTIVTSPPEEIKLILAARGTTVTFTTGGALLLLVVLLVVS